MKRLPRIAAFSLILLPALVPAAQPAVGQTASAIARLDPNQILGSYYTIARYPSKRQKKCIGKELVLYALGDKKRAVQIVTTCQTKEDNTNAWNASGKFSKAGDGKINVAWIWPFTKKYWFLDVAPDASWALVGKPNHKGLWILSRTPTMSAETLAQIKLMAAGQGFDTRKLVGIKQGP